MNCKCKNEMDALSKVENWNDDLCTSETNIMYWCSKCGRVSIGSEWKEPESIPKPKTIEVPVHEWCDCSHWRTCNITATVARPIFIICPYCGKKLIKEKLASPD